MNNNEYTETNFLNDLKEKNIYLFDCTEPELYKNLKTSPDKVDEINSKINSKINNKLVTLNYVINPIGGHCINGKYISCPLNDCSYCKEGNPLDLYFIVSGFNVESKDLFTNIFHFNENKELARNLVSIITNREEFINTVFEFDGKLFIKTSIKVNRQEIEAPFKKSKLYEKALIYAMYQDELFLCYTIDLNKVININLIKCFHMKAFSGLLSLFKTMDNYQFRNVNIEEFIGYLIILRIFANTLQIHN